MNWKLLLICGLLAALLCGCGSSVIIEGIHETDPDTEVETTVSDNPFWGNTATKPAEDESDVEFPYDYTMTTFFQYQDCWDHAPLAVCKGVLKDGSPYHLQQQDGHHVAQAACADGTYGYFFMTKPADGVNPELQYIFKVDLSTWEIVKRSEEMFIQHANSACYNEKTGLIYSVNQKPDGKDLTIIDPETLEPVGTQSVAKDICAIAYCSQRDQYVVRLVGTQAFDFAVLDANFQWVAEYTGINSLLGVQNIACDENYIYRLDSGCVKMPGTEGIVVYDWNGNYKGTFRIAIDMGGANLMEVGETESLFIHDGKFYLSILSGSGGLFYHLDMDLNELYW